MFRWRISIFGKTPARSLGIITAPDDEAAAHTVRGVQQLGDKAKDTTKQRSVAENLARIKPR